MESVSEGRRKRGMVMIQEDLSSLERWAVCLKHLSSCARALACTIEQERSSREASLSYSRLGSIEIVSNHKHECHVDRAKGVMGIVPGGTSLLDAETGPVSNAER